VAKRSSTLPALEDRFDQEKETFFLRVDAAYAALAAAEPGRIRVVGAEGDPAEVGERIWAVVKTILPATRAPG
jgi:thymidylate kinase